MLPDDYLMITINIPTKVKLKTTFLRCHRTGTDFLHQLLPKKIGDVFVSQNEFAVMRVPSVVTPGDFNYLLNPKHVDFSKIVIKACVPFPSMPA